MVMLLISLDYEVTETQDLNMRHSDLHNTFFPHLRRTRYKSVNNALAKSVGSGASQGCLGSNPR